MYPYIRLAGFARLWR